MGAFLDDNPNKNTFGKWSEVNAQIRAVASEDPRVLLVESKDLPHKGDWLHFNAEGARALGDRYFETYKKATEKPPLRKSVSFEQSLPTTQKRAEGSREGVRRAKTGKTYTTRGKRPPKGYLDETFPYWRSAAFLVTSCVLAGALAFRPKDMASLWGGRPRK